MQGLFFVPPGKALSFSLIGHALCAIGPIPCRCLFSVTRKSAVLLALLSHCDPVSQRDESNVVNERLGASSTVGQEIKRSTQCSRRGKKLSSTSTCSLMKEREKESIVVYRVSSFICGLESCITSKWSLFFRIV